MNHPIHQVFFKNESMYNNDMKRKIISSSAQVMGGTPVFHGTRVPVKTLLDYLEGGDTINDFLDGFPTVKKSQVIAYLESVKKTLKNAA